MGGARLIGASPVTRALAALGGCGEFLAVIYDTDAVRGAFFVKPPVDLPGRAGGFTAVSVAMAVLEDLRERLGEKTMRIGVCFPGAPDSANDERTFEHRIVEGMTHERVRELAALPTARSTRAALVHSPAIVHAFRTVGSEADALRALELAIDVITALSVSEPIGSC